MNPFSAISNQEHAKALAEAFVCLHLGATRTPADIEDQLYSMLRFYRRLHGFVLGAYLDGAHFMPWGNGHGFYASAANCADVQDLASAYLGE